MSTTVYIPDELSHRMKEQAAELNLSLEDYVLHLLVDAVADDQEPWTTREEVVAQIRDTAQDPAAYHPPQLPLSDLLVSAEDEEPIDALAWNQDWAQIERSMHQNNSRC